MAIFYFPEELMKDIVSTPSMVVKKRQPVGEPLEFFENRKNLGASPRRMGRAVVTQCVPVTVGAGNIKVDSQVLKHGSESDSFAVLCGFRNHSALSTYISNKYKGLPFKGWFITWGKVEL